MCIINDDKKGKYEVEICDLKDNCICSLKFASVTLLCRFLEDFDFEKGNCYVYKTSDLQYYDPAILLYIWRGIKNEL